MLVLPRCRGSEISDATFIEPFIHVDAVIASYVLYSFQSVMRHEKKLCRNRCDYRIIYNRFYFEFLNRGDILHWIS